MDEEMKGNDRKIHRRVERVENRAALENRDRVPSSNTNEYEPLAKRSRESALSSSILFPSRSAARDSYLFSLRRARLLEEGYGGGGKLRNHVHVGGRADDIREHRVPHTLCASDCTASTTPGAPIGSP